MAFELQKVKDGGGVVHSRKEAIWGKPHRTHSPTEHMSIPDRRWTVHFTWSPGAYKLPSGPGHSIVYYVYGPGGSWRRDVPGWEKAENKFTATSGLRVRVCVCPVSPTYIHVCVPVCRVCH